MAIKRHFGIDFGTTNSSIVELISDGDLVATLTHGDDEGRPMPSIIAINKQTGEVYAGRDAWEKRTELAEDCECIRSVKSLLELEGWSKNVAGRTWTAQDIATEVFKALRATVTDYDENEVMNATVAIPVGFSRAKRSVLRKAAKNAGIAIEGFISEPTAAFFANYDDLKSDEVVVIFDWGGGTLDVSVIRHSSGRISELATAGMQVAGDDIDELLARKIHSIVAHKTGVQISFDEMPPYARDTLLVRAERAKRALSEDDDAVVSVAKYGELGMFRERITYEWFDSIMEGIALDAIGCLDKALGDAGISDAGVDRLVMVGGSSNNGPLLDRLAERFEEVMLFPEETVWSISTGAAKLSKNPGRFFSAQKVGMILADGSYFPLLDEGTVVSKWSKEVAFGLVDTSSELRVVFSGSKDIDESDDRRQVVNIPSYKFLEEKILIRAFIDEDLVFRVEMRSNMRKSAPPAVWEYDKLKLYYSPSECGL